MMTEPTTRKCTCCKCVPSPPPDSNHEEPTMCDEILAVFARRNPTKKEIDYTIGLVKMCLDDNLIYPSVPPPGFVIPPLVSV